MKGFQCLRDNILNSGWPVYNSRMANHWVILSDALWAGRLLVEDHTNCAEVCEYNRNREIEFHTVARCYLAGSLSSMKLGDFLKLTGMCRSSKFEPLLIARIIIWHWGVINDDKVMSGGPLTDRPSN